MFFAEHSADIPFCYYNRYTGKMDIKLNIHNDNVKSVNILFNDPYDYEVTGDVWLWAYKTQSMDKLYVSKKLETWSTSIEIPKWKRIKYAFSIETVSGETFYFSENICESVKNIDTYATGHHNHFSFPFVHEVDAPKVPTWVEDVVWYQIFPERFRNGNPSINPENCQEWTQEELTNGKLFFGGDLYGIVEKLDYLQDLGVNGIYMTPIFESPSNHKYDTIDYMEIDKHFGDKKIFKTLVDEAHKRGMKVMIDAVYNHIGEKHVFWQDVLENQENSKYKDYFHIRKFPVNEKKDYKDLNFDTFAYVTSMPKWNTENPEVRKYLLDVSKYWIEEFDVDGWRLDVANEVSFDFWKDFSEAVRGVKEDIYILGEIWFNSSKWINPGYFDAVMNYTIGFPIKEMFLEDKIDGEAMTAKLFKSMMKYSEIHNRVGFNLIDSHDTERTLTTAKGDKQKVKNAFTFLFMLPGSPMLYYGTEVALFGKHDPDCRRPMNWDFSTIDKNYFEFYQKLIKFRKDLKKFIFSSKIYFVSNAEFDLWKLESNEGDIEIYYNKQDKAIQVENKNQLLFTTNDLNVGTKIEKDSISIFGNITLG